VIQLPPDYGDYPEHDHAESGQEEVYLAIGGSGWMDIEGERVELDPETFVRVAAEPRRKVYAGPEGLRMLVIGGCPGEPYKIAPNSELASA
jgi:mannose-6-phosphate isomerase-like protein (cupin superfamily)